MKYLQYVSLAILLSVAMASHIDDVDGELTKFSYDSVVFRLQKDCSLDRIPEVSI